QVFFHIFWVVTLIMQSRRYILLFANSDDEDRAANLNRLAAPIANKMIKKQPKEVCTYDYSNNRANK
ncbi:MAG: hypothetical protein ACLR22_04140, partial [Lacticaseibacillus paracasei]